MEHVAILIATEFCVRCCLFSSMPEHGRRLSGDWFAILL